MEENMLLHISSPSIEQLLAFRVLQPDKPLNVLLTYAKKQHFNDFQVLHRNKICSLILDSGAYTLNRSEWARRPKNLLKEYAVFSRYTSRYYDFIFNLDENFTSRGYEENMMNQFELEDIGLDPVPVVHNLFNGEIERLIDLGYEIIAIGQCENGRSFKQLESAVNRIHSAGRKVHLFGITEYQILRDLPVWSCDSSSWAQYVQYGQVMWWNDANKDWAPWDVLYFPKRQEKHDPKKGKNYFDYAFKDEFDAYIWKNLGLTVDDLLGEQKVMNRSLINIFFYKEMELRITAHHRDVMGFIFPD